MEYVLCRLCKDWADEFYCESFAVMTKARWKEVVAEVKKAGSWEFNFGTNEGWEEIDFKQWKADIEVTNISEAEAKTIINLFSTTSKGVEEDCVFYGTASGYIDPTDYFEYDKEDEENEEE